MKTLSAYQRLTAVIQTLSRVRSLEEITAIVRKAARDLTGADGATFVLRDNGYCFYVDEEAIGPLWKGQRFPMTSCVSGWAMLNKKSVIIPDIFEDPRVPVDAYKPTFVKSLAMVPIRIDSPIGAIGVYWAHKYLPTEEQVSLLQALADTTSVALENVQLYDSLQSRIRELNESNNAKDTLLTLVSHELRTPLNSIQGWAQILVEEGLSERDLKQGIDAIYRNAKLQAHIIDELIAASQIILERYELKKETTDFIALVKEVIDRHVLPASEKNIQIRTAIQLEQALVNGEKERLQKVIEILLGNAVKFTPPGGKISITTERLGPSIVFRITDSGIGIAPDFINDLFKTFKQAEKTLTRTYGGLGLELAMAKQLVTAHGGQIAASSEGLGKGSTFTVTLPLEKSLLETNSADNLSLKIGRPEFMDHMTP